MSNLLKNSIFRAYGTSLLGVFSGLVTSLWLLREITIAISVHDFGIYAFVLQISGYLTILQLGLDFAASRQIAESLGRNDASEASRAFSQLLQFNRKLVVLALVVVFSLSALLYWGLVSPHSIDAASTRLTSELALVAGIAQVITFLSRPYSAALIGSQFQATVNILAVVRTLCTSVLAFLFLRAGFYVLCVPAAEVVMQLVNWLLLRMLAYRKCKWRSNPTGTPPKTMVLGSMLRYGGLTSLGGLAWTLESSLDVVILGTLTNAGVVASYVLWWRFPQMLFDLSTRLAWSAFPRFSLSFGESRAAAQIIFSKVAYLTVGLATLALVGITLWLRPFVHLWIGTEYLGVQSTHLAMLMGLLVCLRVFGNLLSMFWLASGHAEFTTALAWAQAVLKLVLAVLLVPRWGILGLIIASCVASLLQVAAMSWFLLRQRLLTLALGMRALAFIAFAVLISLMAARGTFTVDWFGLIGGVIATALLWAVLWLVLALTGELRQPIISLLRGLSRRIPLLKAY